MSARELDHQRDSLFRLTANAWEAGDDQPHMMYEALIVGLIYVGDCIRAASQRGSDETR